MTAIFCLNGHDIKEAINTISKSGFGKRTPLYTTNLRKKTQRQKTIININIIKSFYYSINFYILIIIYINSI